MRMRLLLPLVAVAALLAACGDDGDDLFAGVEGTADTGSGAPDDTGSDAPTGDTGSEESPASDPADPITEGTAGPFADDTTSFTFPTLPDDRGGSPGSPSGDGMENQIIDAFAEEFASEPMFDVEQGRCIGQILYDELGVDGLTEIGQAPSPDQWPPEAVDTLMDAMWDCVEFQSLMVDEMTSSGATEDQAQCVWDAFTEDEWKELILEMTMDPSSSTLQDEFESRASQCR